VGESTDNPYRSPESDGAAPLSELRSSALRTVRKTLVVLAIPALLNWWCLHFVYSPRGGGRYGMTGSTFMPLLAAANFVLAVTAFVGLWLFGLKALDCAAVVAHHLAGEGQSQQEWIDSMHLSLRPMPAAALVGAALWCLWLYLFFLDARYPVWFINLALGGVGHVVAATVYGWIIYNWWRLKRMA